MDETNEKEETLTQIFKDYDWHGYGYLTAEQVQAMHAEMRIGGVSMPQVLASIEYTCLDNVVEKTELFDMLQELDRRYFLVQDLRWEFTMMDYTHTDTIAEQHARWFVQTVHGECFSKHQWELFLRTRAVPGSGVNFSEIEVILCNIPSKQDMLKEEEEERLAKTEEENKRREVEAAIEAEKRKRKQSRDEEARKKTQEEAMRLAEDERRRRQEEEERLQRQFEKEEAERRRKQLAEEEERGRLEAEERERKMRKEAEELELARREAEKARKLAEKEAEAKRLLDLEQQYHRELAEQHRQHEQEAQEYEKILAEATAGQREAEDAAKSHGERAKSASDENVRKAAAEAEEQEKLKAKEFNHKRIRFGLKAAIKRKDRATLPPAVEEFKKARLPDSDMDLQRAEHILREFQAEDGLSLALSKRQLADLEMAVNYIKKYGFEARFTRELIEANKVLIQLRRLERIRAEILELKQSTVAEIKSYQAPPPIVHTVMTGTFLVLGHFEKEMQNWQNIQVLVGKTGKEGLKRRCLQLDPGDMDQVKAARAQKLMAHLDLDDVRDVSAGAATFFLWSTTMIEEMYAKIEALKFKQEIKRKDDKQVSQAEGGAATKPRTESLSPTRRPKAKNPVDAPDINRLIFKVNKDNKVRDKQGRVIVTETVVTTRTSRLVPVKGGPVAEVAEAAEPNTEVAEAAEPDTEQGDAGDE